MVAFEKKEHVIPRERLWRHGGKRHLTRNPESINGTGSQRVESSTGSSSHLKAGLDRNDRHSQPNITTATGGGLLLCTKKSLFIEIFDGVYQQDIRHLSNLCDCPLSHFIFFAYIFEDEEE